MDKKSQLISEMIKYYAGDVKRINHFLKVYSFAETIARTEELDISTLELIETAAIVHDIGIKISEQKYNSSSGKYQQIEGPAIAEELLERLGYSENIIKRISFLVGHHHTYQAIDGVDFQILIEADFLVNIFEDEIQRDEVLIIRDKYFKSKAAIEFLDKLYLTEK